MTTETFTVSQVAEWVGGQVCGDGDRALSGLAPFDAAGPADLTFALDDKRLDAVADTQAGAVIVPAEADLDVSVPLIRVEKVDHAIAALLAQFAPPPDLPEGIHPSAVIEMPLLPRSMALPCSLPSGVAPVIWPIAARPSPPRAAIDNVVLVSEACTSMAVACTS